MNRSVLCVAAIFTILTCVIAAKADEKPPEKVRCPFVGGAKTNAATFDRWINEVWHEGKLELVDKLVGSSYVRHEAGQNRTVTRAEYAAEITGVRKALGGPRFIIHECMAVRDRVWTRWSMIGTNAESGKKLARMGTQVYRLEDSRLVETWILIHPADLTWPEAAGRRDGR